MTYCRTLGTEPYLCLNMGTGTLDEACAWIEYCNGTRDTDWANLRRTNGHPEPYGVRYWGLGNEMYGEWQIGSLRAEDYVERARQWAHALHQVDPDIELVSCGNDGVHSIHLYTGSDDYWSNVLAPLLADRALRTCSTLLARACHLQGVDRSVRIAYDEWNVWFHDRAQRPGVEERYTLADAIAVATFCNVFVRRCQTLSMANLAQTVNVIAPIITRRDGLFLQTIYHPLRLAATLTREVALDALVLCDVVEHVDPPTTPPTHRVGDLGPFPVLDVAASRDEGASAATLSVINRDPTKAADVVVEVSRPLAGEAQLHEVWHEDVLAVNSFEVPDRVDVRTRTITVSEGEVRLQLPPHSITFVELALR
jgi:alpha-N-arabinofuranosidase